MSAEKPKSKAEKSKSKAGNLSVVTLVALVLAVVGHYVSSTKIHNISSAKLSSSVRIKGVTSLNGGPGSGGCAAGVAMCPAVFNFLTAQAMDYQTYATSKLWAVVDGPWRLTTFSLLHGPDTFVPNPAYSGSPSRRSPSTP